MTTNTILKQIASNLIIAAIFVFVFINQMQPAFAQAGGPVDPYGNGNQNGGYQQDSYSYQTYQPITNNSSYIPTQNTPQSVPIRVTTYEPSYYATSEGVNVTLKGDIAIPDSYTISNVWFEWGETSSLGQKTSSQSVNVSFTFQTTLRDLKADKTYYYRAVGQNTQGIVRGELITVRTPSLAKVANSETYLFGFGSGAATQTKTTDTSLNTSATKTATTTGTVSGSNTNTQSETTSGTGQTALGNASSGGLFPTTLFGWIVLAIFVFIVVGFLIYLNDLYQELKKKQEEEKKRQANGNGNGNHFNMPAQA